MQPRDCGGSEVVNPHTSVLHPHPERSIAEQQQQQQQPVDGGSDQ